MFSKRSLPKYSDQPKEKRLRTNIEDLYFTNQVSAERASSLLQDAEAAGSARTGDLHSFKPSAGHHKRDLQRKLVRYSNWPKPYFVSVEVWDPKKKAAVHKLLPMWLPHELVGYIAKWSSLENFLDKGGMSVDTAAHVTKVEAQAGATLLGLRSVVRRRPLQLGQEFFAGSCCLKFPRRPTSPPPCCRRKPATPPSSEGERLKSGRLCLLSTSWPKSTAGMTMCGSQV